MHIQSLLPAGKRGGLSRHRSNQNRCKKAQVRSAKVHVPTTFTPVPACITLKAATSMLTEANTLRTLMSYETKSQTHTGLQRVRVGGSLRADCFKKMLNCASDQQPAPVDKKRRATMGRGSLRSRVPTVVGGRRVSQTTIRNRDSSLRRSYRPQRIVTPSRTGQPVCGYMYAQPA